MHNNDALLNADVANTRKYDNIEYLSNVLYTIIFVVDVYESDMSSVIPCSRSISPCRLRR